MFELYQKEEEMGFIKLKNKRENEENKILIILSVIYLNSHHEMLTGL